MSLAGLLHRRGMMGGSTLPYDARIEYLQSSGTQYIELPFGFDNTDEIYAELSIDATMGSDKFMVCPKTWNNNNNRFGFGLMYNYPLFCYCAAYGSLGTSSSKLSPETHNDGNIHRWVYSNGTFEITDLNLSFDASAASFGGTTANLKLFYGYNANTSGKISYYKHIKNGVTVIELIPVRVGQVGYLYDKVSGQLYGNAGSGSFTLGNDV